MKNTVSAVAGIVTLVLLLGTPCFGIDLPQAVPAKEGFTMHMPAEWKPIPREILNRYCQAIAKLAPNAEKQTYEYGFQRADAPKWFAYPYILLQVKRSGRIPEEQLESLQRIEKAMDDSFAKATDSLSSFTSKATIGEPFYDVSHHILWTRVAIDVKEIGTVRGIVGAILTSEGFIQVACYARDADFKEYLPVFEAIVKNTEIRNELQYTAEKEEGKKESADGTQGAFSMETIALVFAGAILIIIGWKASRRKS
jgi:hypothetical protein